ncbi:MAG: DHH family phosphoesterase [Patescibacteria group bacterium]|nr:DHH family phosphoesterase [Patescibacteria group bacterium]
MKNLKEVSCRIREAVENNEKIVLFSDSDLDGITSAIMLEKSIALLGGKSVVYNNNIEKEGRGLTEVAVNSIKEEAPALLITMDCGISNFRGVKKANSSGFQVIVIDHHQTHDRLPEASLILDPMQEDDNYPFKKMANAGIVYKLSKEILKEKFSEKEREFLELTTLATFADMMPKEGDNLKIIKKGLESLKNPVNLGLKILKKNLSEEKLIEKAVFLLNNTRHLEKTTTGYHFLIEKKEEKAKEIAEELKDYYKERQILIKKAEEEIEKEILPDEPIIFMKGNFPPFLTGTVATRVIRKHKKPVFIYIVENGYARGSVRVPFGDDAVDMMKKCKHLLENFGGHAPAAGFRLKEDNLEEFKKCLINNSLYI